jgi:probable addiction module antidote protein
MTRKNMRAVSRGHDEATVESLRKDPKFAVEYLNAVLQEGDEQELMVAMRRIADAMGGVPQLASKTKLNATTLYRTLSKKGNPELRSMTSMLKAMGLRLAVQPISKSG